MSAENGEEAWQHEEGVEVVLWWATNLGLAQRCHTEVEEALCEDGLIELQAGALQPRHCSARSHNPK